MSLTAALPGAGPVRGSGPAAVPFALTGGHFAVALAFLLAGAWGLLWAAPQAAEGRYLMPQVVAVTHLFTLGWLTTSMMGALYQLLPVVLGTTVASQRLGYVSLALYGPGLALFVAGLLAGATNLMLAGVALFGPGLLLFIGNTGVGVLRVRRRDVTWWAVTAALLFLLVTLVLGASLAGNLRWHHLGANRPLAVGVHMHIALGGWVLLLVVGVARRLLPMFLLSHGSSERPGAAAALLAGIGAGILALFHHAPSPFIVRAAALLLASGAVAFLVQCALYLRRSHRPALDAGLRLAASGLVFLAASIPLGLVAFLAAFANARLNAAYGAALILGGFTLFVAGHYYKILPFLVWNHRFAGLAGSGRSLPRVADLFDARAAHAAFLLLVVGAAGLALGVAAGMPAAARGGAFIFAAGATIETGQMLKLFRTGPES